MSKAFQKLKFERPKSSVSHEKQLEYNVDEIIIINKIKLMSQNFQKLKYERPKSTVSHDKQLECNVDEIIIKLLRLQGKVDSSTRHTSQRKRKDEKKKQDTSEDEESIRRPSTDSRNSEILLEHEIICLCKQAKELFLSQPTLLELSAPLKILGDIHGQFQDLLRWFDLSGYPPDYNYLFLGDYVDRGMQSIETICLLLAYKVKYPENFFMLRGNHECAYINAVYGFYDDCLKKYNIKIWKTFTEVFNCLPLAALVDEKIFCVHGGISPKINDISQIKQIVRPVDVPHEGIISDLLWSDPNPNCDLYCTNERGISYSFGKAALKQFLELLDLDLVCRAHQVTEDGYEFFANRRLVTIFSAPNYCGEFDNAAAMMEIDDALNCSFHILRPVKKVIKSSTLRRYINFI